MKHVIHLTPADVEEILRGWAKKKLNSDIWKGNIEAVWAGQAPVKAPATPIITLAASWFTGSDLKQGSPLGERK